MLPNIHKQNREEENLTGSALFWRQDEAVYVSGRATYARDITNVSALLLCSNLLNNQLSTESLLQIQVRIFCAIKCHRVLELKYPTHPTKASLGIPVKQGDLLQRRLGSRSQAWQQRTHSPSSFPKGYFLLSWEHQRRLLLGLFLSGTSMLPCTWSWHWFQKGKGLIIINFSTLALLHVSCYYTNWYIKDE